MDLNCRNNFQIKNAYYDGLAVKLVFHKQIGIGFLGDYKSAFLNSRPLRELG